MPATTNHKIYEPSSLVPLPVRGREGRNIPPFSKILAPSMPEDLPQTFNYRWTGEDTLTYGDQQYWIEAKLAHHCLEEETVFELDFDQTCLRWSQPLKRIQVSMERSSVYSFDSLLVVGRFLSSNPHLVDILMEAVPHIRTIFGAETRVVLRIISDPEMENQDQLFGCIRTNLSVDEALSCLDRFDEEWFFNRFDQVAGLLDFKLDFV